jgi:anti-sigma regulatory factor (Ser/Thr protein kinase)
MDSFLIHEGRPTVDDASVSVAREDVRDLAGKLGFSAERTGELAIAVSELATNQLRHARLGRIALRAIARDGVQGIEMIAFDRGPGIADPRTALAGVPRSHGSLGTGLSSVMRFSDEVDFDVRIGERTAIFARRFAGPVRRRASIALLGRPHPHEALSGDDAWFERSEHGVRLVLADGLGHGPPARQAAGVFISYVRETGGDATRLLEGAHDRLRETRGAVGLVCDVDEDRALVTTTAIGNVIVQVVGGRSFTGSAGVIGARPPRRAPIAESRPLPGRGIVLGFTDGLTSRVTIDRFDDVTREHPLIIAQHLLETFGRDNDDATVFVLA